MLFIISIAAFGQGKITLKEEKLSDLMPKSLYKTKTVGYLFKVDDSEYQAVGYKGENIAEILKKDKEAYKEFEKFQRKTRGSKVLLGIAVAAPLIFPLTIDYDNDTDREFFGKLITMGIVSIGSSITSGILNRNAPKHLINAVEIYNQNLE